MVPPPQPPSTLLPQPPHLQQQQQQQLQPQPQQPQAPPPMHLALHPHPHPPPPRPPLPQPPQMGIPSSVPSSMAISMPSSLPVPVVSSESIHPRPGAALSSAPMLHSSQYASLLSLSGQSTQGSSNQMRSALSQSHGLGLSSMHPGQVSGSGLPSGIGGFANGITNTLESQNSVTGASPFQPNTVGMQPQPPVPITSTSGMFNRPQGGPIPPPMMTSGLNTYQSTAPPNMMDVRGPGTNPGTNVGLGMGMGLGVPPHPHGPSPPQL